MSAGPVIAALRVWPSSMRGRVAARPPDQFAEPTEGTSGADPKAAADRAPSTVIRAHAARESP